LSEVEFQKLWLIVALVVDFATDLMHLVGKPLFNYRVYACWRTNDTSGCATGCHWQCECLCFECTY